MAEYIKVEVATEAAQLLDTAIEKLEAEMVARGVENYKPSEADLEIIILGVISTMAADAAVVASTLLDAAFRKYGVEAFGLLYNEGAFAKAATTWTQLPEGGKYPVRTIEAGLQLEAAGLAFQVESNVTTISEQATVTVEIVAVERGTEYNGISSGLSLVNSLNYVKEVAFSGETSGGVNQETDEEYMARLTSILRLQAPRPITASNFAEMTLYGSSGVAVERATAIDGYNPETITIEAKTNSSTTLTEVSTFTGVSLESVSLPQKHPGSMLHYEGDATYATLPRNTTAVSKKAAAEMVISPAALKSEAKHKIEVIGKYEEPKYVTVFVKLPKKTRAEEGEAAAIALRTTIQKYLESYREINFKVLVEPPSYNEIQITAEVHCLPGYTEATVAENVKVALETFLSPANYGNPSGAAVGGKTWLNATEAFGLLRYNQLIGVMEAVAGVAYVPSGSAGLSIGLAEAPGSKTADLALVGPAPLTYTEAATVKVTAV